MSTQKSKQGERTLIRFVKQDRKRSLHDLMNEFSQSVLLIHPDVAEIPAVFSHGSSRLFF
jgi:hypothetical protein